MKSTRRFLLVLTAAALLALLVFPSTRWVIGLQVGSALHLCHPFEKIFDYISPHDPAAYTGLAAFDRKRVQTVLARHPHDFPLQMGAVMPYSTGGLFARESLRALIPRFPDTPSLYANLLRCDASGPVRLERPEIDALTGEQPGKSSYRPVPTPADLASYDRTAATGERLDPDNAYFPFMRAVGHFAAHRDAVGLAALRRAGTKPIWKEYYHDEAAGRQHLHAEAFGSKSAIQQAAFMVMTLLPQYTDLTHAAYLAVSKAAAYEQSGDPNSGLAVRQSLTHLGGLMRVQSTTLVGTERGIRIAEIAAINPGGKSQTQPDKDPPIDTNAAARNEAYCRYLAESNQSAEARQAQAEYAAEQRVRHMLSLDVKDSGFGPVPNPVIERSAFGHPLRQLILWWAADLSVLSNILWILVLGLIASLLARVRRLGKVEPLSVRLRFGAFFLFCIGAAAIWFAAGWQSNTLEDIRAALLALNGYSSATFFTGSEGVVAVLSLFGYLAVPILTLVALTISSLVRRVPLASGLVHGVRSTAVPIACLLMLLYCGLVLGTSKQEKSVGRGLNQMQQNQGRYFADLTGQAWPGAVP